MQRRSFMQLSLAALAASAVPRAAKAAAADSLREIANVKGLFVGTAVSFSQLNRPEFAALLADQCSILVSENDMKWRATQPEQNRYDFAHADAFMNFAESKKIRARGHNLCWHEHNPDWLDSTATPQNAVALLQQHITTVAGRYKGRIHSWDVVNEAIRPDHHNHNDMVNSVWLKNIGEDYIEIAFRAAAAADPSALLTYNDYGIETDAPDQEKKRDAILSLLHRLRKKNVPLHAMGIQSHLRAHDDQQNWNGLSKFLKDLEKLNLQIFLTELDVDDSLLPGDVPDRDRLIAELYRSYLDAALRNNSVKAVLTWGFSDADTWLNGFRPRKDGLRQRPLPFDADLHPKPAFQSMRDAISNHPNASSAQ